ncbi:hypothetical protein AJ85_16665 [Alkalihalobacillus alcalophilus ATCC 27647 = CGMCC 1.3604]|uniref:Uncharacterized protein n=1 Tax=Alkalihalobacillus alcalophilus ATCC 27647 = CGMCC 1.3604 TaxID=1218173 RepID=A0A094XEX9_ALKAL|nr:hypothetical protein [Alkalihalobacillus alcalophilus]KGA97310.1 hypothetical protein BALCAV_0210900 [Alkalihalobacillus alcalophilus ATCC 27647 = CGMCC 1.3604]MED1562512.1 hypothetical protein [Alkalihalobacillus alcalophilus]THG92149.1 hypothetical protein AJ85_16665 [Alkalihalobacillus alcalophilus ATCC 27647 = CGMCC 1.3604]
MSKTPSTTSFHDKEIQYKQKLLHYRSEVTKLTNEGQKKDQLLKEQQDTILSLKEKIKQIPQEIMAVDPKLYEDTFIIQSYFAYSMMIPKEDHTVTIKGHFIMKNLGTTPLHEPIICFVFNQPKLSNLAGKISHPKQRDLNMYLMDDQNLEQSWSFTENQSRKEAKKTGQYWLRPNNIQKLEPNETLSFSDFEIEIPKGVDNPSFVVDAYIYGREISEGKSADNQIMCNIF